MNLFIVTKIFITAIIITAITEISKKSVSVGGLVAAMPILTIIALFWFYYEKKDNMFLAGFTKAVFAGFPMTIMFFIPTIYLFKKGYNFYFVMLVGVLFLGIGAYIQQKIMN